jgi:geranylgeranyl diphosphate synthase type I
MTDSEVDALVATLEAAGVVADVKQAAENILDHGRQTLGLLPGSDERRLLFELGDFFVSRGH